jgi:glycosyltransferase involved in cell wall biosynthesis
LEGWPQAGVGGNVMAHPRLKRGRLFPLPGGECNIDTSPHVSRMVRQAHHDMSKASTSTLTSTPHNRQLILLCTGLGRVQRGFEMYIRSLAEKLGETELRKRLEVWSGGSVAIPGVKTKRILNVYRNGWFGKLLGGKAFLWEQRTFFLGMLPHLFKHKNAVFYLGEYQLYCYLFKVRKILGLNYSLVLYTGGQAIPGLFNARMDFVHHVTDVYLPECGHIPANRQVVLPHFIQEDFVYDAAWQQEILQKAGGKKIVLSVGLLDKTIKRMDLLVKSLVPLAPGVFPILLGEPSTDTEEIKKMLEASFGKDGFILQKVDHPALGNWYSIADVFVLCSPKESFGLAMVEALYHGLPVICADFPEARFVLGSQGCYIDMSQAATLTKAIIQWLQTGHDREESKQYAQEHFTWASLKPAYLQMFDQVMTSPPRRGGRRPGWEETYNPPPA